LPVGYLIAKTAGQNSNHGNCRLNFDHEWPQQLQVKILTATPAGQNAHGDDCGSEFWPQHLPVRKTSRVAGQNSAGQKADRGTPWTED